jgi:hypothetical protein
VPSVTIDGVLGSERYREGAAVQDRQHCKLVSTAEPITCGYTRKDIQFAYTLVANIADSRGRTNSVTYDVPWYGQSDPDFAVVPDKKLYKPGDIAKLEIKSKIVPASAVVSFARQGIIVQKRVETASSSDGQAADHRAFCERPRRRRSSRNGRARPRQQAAVATHRDRNQLAHRRRACGS